MLYDRLVRRFAKSRAVTAPPEAAPALPGLKVRFDVGDETNPLWKESDRGYRITVPRNPVLDGNGRVFTMGSCFALEIRKALESRGYDVFPKYRQIEINPDMQRLAKIPVHDDVTHYDTFTIRQEFESAFAERHYGVEDFFSHRHRIRNGFAAGGRTSWQDPYRKKVFAADEDSILDVSQKIDNCIAEGIANSDVYIITLGLIETWRNTRNGAHICLPPYDDKRGGLDKFDYIKFHMSTYQENLDNLTKVCQLIKDNYPERKIILTVSPVGLGRTYSGKDVWVATVEAKSILRAVAAQLCRDFDNVLYWPSYDLCIKDDIYKADGRHVREDAIAMIVNAFEQAHAVSVA